MQFKFANRPYLLFTALALVAASTLALTGAFAGDQAAPASAMPAAGTAPVTKTVSPIHTMMGWVAGNVVGDLESPCPSCPKAETAWRSWFDGGKDVALAGLRDRLVADGWTADRYISYFQAMAKAHPKASGGDCQDCPSSKKDCEGKSCDSCPGGCAGKKNAEPEPASTASK